MPPNEAPSNVLVIDDAIIDNYIFELLLKRVEKHSNVTACLNGKTAIDQLKKLKLENMAAMPEYIFVDITMPTMDGWEFLNEFTRLNIDPLKQSKVYILTSSLFTSDYDKSLLYPFLSGYIRKPLDIGKMNEVFGAA
jgi:CheY-like chemotaxis protein